MNEDLNVSPPNRGGITGEGSVSVYSRNETVIGTWLDGEPIYRKVFHCNTPISPTEHYDVADCSDLNIDNVISLQAIIHVGSMDYPVSNIYINSNQYAYLTFSKLNKKIRQYITYTRMCNCTQDIIIEYTKSENASTYTPEVHILPSGRKLWRHESNEGSVIECTMHGMPLQLFIADAKYRASKALTPPKSGAVVNSRTGTNWFPGYSLNPNDMPVLNDTWMDENVYYFDKTPCNYANNQCDLIATSAAVTYTRSLTFLDEHGLDVPNAWEMFMLMAEGDYIDELDPTVISSSSNLRLGYNTETSARFCNKTVIGSCDSTQTSATYGNYCASYYSSATITGVERRAGGSTAMILPIRELNLF